MKIYKFKDLTDEKKHSHFYQIVLQNIIWCAGPDSFNDENEFKIKLDYNPSAFTANLLTQVVAKYRTTNYFPPNLSVSFVLDHGILEKIAEPIINEMIRKCRNEIGVISFSVNKTVDYLWREYGGRGNGVCIGINVPDSLIGKSYHRVHYVTEKIFHIDCFLECALFQDRAFENFKNILLTKTRKWLEEEEVRFIGNQQGVNLILDGYISELIFGPNVPEYILSQIEANIADHCSSNKIRITKMANVAH